MESAIGTRKPHMGRRRLVMLGIAGAFVAAGLFVMADQALVAALLGPILGSATSPAGAGLAPYGNASYAAYLIGFGILMTGVGLLRSTMHQSLSGYASGGSAMGAGFSPEAMQQMLATSMARMNAAAAPSPPTPVVKLKCGKCGSLEEPDAAFCHKCGAAM